MRKLAIRSLPVTKIFLTIKDIIFYLENISKMLHLFIEEAEKGGTKMISTKAIFGLMAVLLLMFLMINLRSTAMAEEKQPRKELAPCHVIYKTEAEIALDLLMYAVQNKILETELGNYDAFIEGYRKALNVVINPAKPVPKAKEGQ